MRSKAEDVFGEKLELVVRLAPKFAAEVHVTLREDLEVAAALAQKVALYSPSYFVEIGCGELALPSLALAALGFRSYEAFDQDWCAIGAGLLAQQSGVHPQPNTNYDIKDFYDWQPDNLPLGTFLIATRPNGGRERPRLGEDIVRLAIEHMCHAAVLPMIHEHDLTTERDCTHYAALLRDQGYTVETPMLLSDRPETQMVIGILDLKR